MGTVCHGERQNFSEWAMGGIYFEPIGTIGGLCPELSTLGGQVAGFRGRRNGAELAKRRQRAVLYGRRQTDRHGRENRRADFRARVGQAPVRGTFGSDHTAKPV